MSYENQNFENEKGLTPTNNWFVNPTLKMGVQYSAPYEGKNADLGKITHIILAISKNSNVTIDTFLDFDKEYSMRIWVLHVEIKLEE